MASIWGMSGVSSDDDAGAVLPVRDPSLPATTISKATAEKYFKECLVKASGVAPRPGTDENDSRTRTALRRRGYRRCNPPTEKDGNCFFRAVTFLYNQRVPFQQKLTYHQLRQNVCDYLDQGGIDALGDAGKAEVEKMGGSIRYLSSMRKDGTWADHVVVSATALLLGLQIQLISCTGLATVISPPPEALPRDPVLLTLGYLTGQHFFAAEQGYSSGSSDSPDRSRVPREATYHVKGQSFVGQRVVSGTSKSATLRSRAARDSAISRLLMAIKKNMQRLGEEFEREFVFYTVKRNKITADKHMVYGYGTPLKNLMEGHPVVRPDLLTGPSVDVHSILTRETPTDITPSKLVTPQKSSIGVGSGARMASEQLEEIRRMKVACDDDEVEIVPEPLKAPKRRKATAKKSLTAGFQDIARKEVKTYTRPVSQPKKLGKDEQQFGAASSSESEVYEFPAYMPGMKRVGSKRKTDLSDNQHEYTRERPAKIRLPQGFTFGSPVEIVKDVGESDGDDIEDKLFHQFLDEEGQLRSDVEVSIVDGDKLVEDCTDDATFPLSDIAPLIKCISPTLAPMTPEIPTATSKASDLVGETAAAKQKKTTMSVPSGAEDVVSETAETKQKKTTLSAPPKAKDVVSEKAETKQKKTTLSAPPKAKDVVSETAETKQMKTTLSGPSRAKDVVIETAETEQKKTALRAPPKAKDVVSKTAETKQMKTTLSGPSRAKDTISETAETKQKKTTLRAPPKAKDVVSETAETKQMKTTLSGPSRTKDVVSETAKTKQMKTTLSAPPKAKDVVIETAKTKQMKTTLSGPPRAKDVSETAETKQKKTTLSAPSRVKDIVSEPAETKQTTLSAPHKAKDVISETAETKQKKTTLSAPPKAKDVVSETAETKQKKTTLSTPSRAKDVSGTAETKQKKTTLSTPPKAEDVVGETADAKQKKTALSSPSKAEDIVKETPTTTKVTAASRPQEVNVPGSSKQEVIVVEYNNSLIYLARKLTPTTLQYCRTYFTFVDFMKAKVKKLTRRQLELSLRQEDRCQFDPAYFVGTIPEDAYELVGNAIVPNDSGDFKNLLQQMLDKYTAVAAEHLRR